jgi:hypothetical protein
VKNIDLRVVVDDDVHESDLTDNIADLLATTESVTVLRNDGFANLLPSTDTTRVGRRPS